MGSAVYLAMNIVRTIGWALGAIPGEIQLFLFSYELCGTLMFLLLLRSGWSKRLADPAMTLAQILFALSSLMISYALLEVTRGATLQLACLILAFGMYHLSSKQIFFSGLFAVGMLVATLFILERLHSQRIDIGPQALNITLATATLLLLAYIGQQVSKMRHKQVQQGKDLSEALRKLQELAMRDALTGLINRRCILDMLGSELKHSQRTGQRFCVAMVDVDFFKRVNDSFGHQAGDAVLVGLAREAALALRKTDIIARWGGEEFLVLLPSTTNEFAKTPLTRLSHQLAHRDWAGALPADTQITLSIGIAESVPDESLDALIARADQALYAAKSSGRNRIAIAPASNSGGA